MKKPIVPIIIIIMFAIIFLFNKKENQSEQQILLPESTIDLAVPEPSALHYDKLTNTLWTVSDENSTIYNISLTGEILSSMHVDGFDLEGITMLNDSTLATILERDRTVIILSKMGNELKRFDLDLTGEPNKGIEGIAYNPTNSHLMVINEKNPGTLIEIDTSGKIINESNLKYASDYSGLYYVEEKNELWIISDEEQSIFKCSVDGSVIEKYKVDVEQIEGIAIDYENSLLYIVSDPLEKLYIYQLP